MQGRKFLKKSVAGVGALAINDQLALSASAEDGRNILARVVDGATLPDPLYHGPEWESLNLGYWQKKERALRRRPKNYGDRARRTGFPFHSETHSKSAMETEYDPSLPLGIPWKRDWKLQGDYKIVVWATFHAEAGDVAEGDKADWEMYQPGYGMLGIASGGRSLFEGCSRKRNATILGWQDNGKLAVVNEPKRVREKRRKGDRIVGAEGIDAPLLEPGEGFAMSLEVTVAGGGFATVKTIFVRIRNLIDALTEVPRGGGVLQEAASLSGSELACHLPDLKTLPNADVRFVHTDGRPIRRTRSLEDGSISLKGPPDIAPGTQLIVAAYDGEQSASQTSFVT